MTLKNGADSFPPLSVTDARAGTVLYPPGGRYGPRLQTDLQLVLVHTGSMRVCIDGTDCCVPAGHVALLKPGHVEEFQFAEKEETWHRWIQVSPQSLCSEWLVVLSRLPFYVPLSDKMNALADLMLAIQQNESRATGEVLRSLGSSAIYLYIAECQSRDASHVKHHAVLMAKAVVQRRYHEHLTVEDLAREGNVTPEHLIRLFRKDENMTPAQYLWNYRIERGLELLRSSGLSIGEIADRTGFKTSYHFARLVKRHSGLTPTEVRRKSWEGH